MPPAPRTVTFITSNKNKLAEVRAMLGVGDDLQIDLRNQSLDLPEIQGTIEEVARDKCMRGAELVKGAILTEDTGLGFRALKGLPGPYIKWFLEALGHEGLNNLLAAYEDKTAEAVCTFAYCAGPGEEVLLFHGITEGKIVPARGPHDFGWDPIFEYKGQTYAEMDKAEKNKISHRYKALLKLKAFLFEHGAEKGRAPLTTSQS